MADGLPRIESVFAWICTDKNDGTEGVPAVTLPNGMIAPMYSSRKDVAMRMQATAEALARDGNKMSLVEFASRITHEEIEAS